MRNHVQWLNFHSTLWQDNKIISSLQQDNKKFTSEAARSCAQHKNLSNERRIERTWLAPNNVKSNQWNWHYQAWPSDDQWHEICKIHNCNFKHHWGFQKFQASSQLNQRFYYEAPMLVLHCSTVHIGAQWWCSKVLGPHNCPLMRWWQFD